MAEAVQLASALTSLIGATVMAVDYLKRLHDAQAYARDLYSKINELRNILESIRPAVELLLSSSAEHLMTEQSQRLQNGIQGCFEKCQQAMDRINAKFRGLVRKDSLTVVQRFRILFAEKDIKLHSAAIEGHIQSLQLSLIALDSLNNTVQHQTTQRLLRELGDFFQYFMVLMAHYPQHQASMGVRAQAVAGETLQISDTGRSIQALPPVNPLDEELELPFNRDIWRRRRTPSLSQPELVSGPSSTAQRESYADEFCEWEMDPENIDEQSLVDSPLAIAVKRNQPAVLEALIITGQDLTITDAEGWTLLHHAIFEESFDALSVLLKSDQGCTQAFKDAKNFQQQTALMLCVRRAESHSSLRLARILLEHNADVNVEDDKGRTALHLLVGSVATSDREAFAQLLVRHGAQFGLNCQRIPLRARDYDAVRDMAQQVRRTSSVATIPETRKFSFKASWRRLSGDTNSIRPPK